MAWFCLCLLLGENVCEEEIRGTYPFIYNFVEVKDGEI